MPNLTRIKNNQVTDSTIVASAKLVSGSVTGGLLSNPLTYTGNMTISGNLTVQGTTTTVDTTNTLVADPVIVLSRGETGSPSNDSGFLVERGTSDNAAFLWDETNDRFMAITTTADGLTGGSISVAAYADLAIANLITSGNTTSGNIKISGNTIESTNTNGNINLTPNGTGDINLSADTTVLGDSNTEASLTTNGTGNIVISTNGNTSSGNIKIAQGANGNITLTANGTGEVVTNTLAVSDLTSGRFVLAGSNGSLTDNGAFTYSGSDAAISGDLAVNGGDLTTTATTMNAFNANATTLNIGGAATAVNIGAATGTTIVKNNLDVDGDINMDGGDFTVSTSTVNIANANATTVNFAGAGTTVGIGANSGTTTINNNAAVTLDLAVNGGDITTTSTGTATVFNANATTLNVGGAATTVAIGAASGTTTINNNAAVTLDLAVNGGDITTTEVTASLFNANAQTVNFAGAATDIQIGAATGTTNVNNNLDVDGNINMDGGNFTTSAATVNIANATTTTVNFAGAATDVQIGAATGTTNVNNSLDVDANINMDGGNFTTTAGTVNIANANSTTVNFAQAATDLTMGATTGTTTIRNDLQISGNDIKSSTGNVAITLNNTDVTIAGNLTIQGGTTTVGTQDLVVEDSLINLHTTSNLTPLVADDGRDVGIIFHYYKTSDKEAALVWANDTSYLEYYVDATETIAGTVTGTYGTIKANSFFSAVSTGTAPFIVNSTTQVANLNAATAGTAATVTTAAQPNITSIGNLTIANIDNIQIDGNTISSTDGNGNIILAPNGTGDVQINSDTLRVGDSNADATITSNGTGNLTLNTNEGTNSGTITIVNGSNGNINLTPNGTGDINLVADTTVLGDSNAEATLTSNGTGNLLLNTNSGTNSGTIKIIQGVNGNITLTPNGTGEVIASTIAVTDLTATRVPYVSTNGALVDSANMTFDGNKLSVANLAVGGNGNVQIKNFKFEGNTITVDNLDGDLVLNPNGAGNVVLESTRTLVGEANTDATVSSNGTADLIFSTNSGTNSGNIRIYDGVNGNITLTPNGTGEVIASTLAVTDLTTNRVVFVGANDALIDDANLTFNGSTLTVTGTGNIAGQFNIDNIRIDGNTISSTESNGNVNIDADGTGDVVINSSKDNSDFYVYGNSSVNANAIVYAKGSSAQVGILTESPSAGATLHINGIDSMIIPKGATGDRPTGVTGMLRYNTSINKVEFYNGTAWTDVTGGFTVIAVDSFAGDGSTVNFTLSQSATSASVIVSINGIVQIPGSAYSVSTTTLSFTEAPVAGDEIDVRLLTTTTTVTSLIDINTTFTLNDTAERANVTVNGNLIMSVSNAAVLPGSDDLYHLGSSSFRWKNVHATNTTIQNADLAENYLADILIEPGTVVSFGGAAELTVSSVDMDTAVAGVVSTNPAHIMNSALEGANVIPLALQGRVPCKVSGTVRKGDMMVSAGDGTARAEANPRMGSVIGKALENFDGTQGVIEVVVGRL